MTDVTIREATAADAGQIAAVNASAIATLRRTYRPSQKAIAQKKTVAEKLPRLVAVVEGRIVGCVDYELTHGSVHFQSLLVHAHHRRQGVARRLLDELVEIGRAAGASRLSAYTVTQTGNTQIFLRLGFRAVSEEASDLFESDRFERLTETCLERPIA